MSRPTRNNDGSFDPTPLWSHVTVLEAPGPGQGGNRLWSCKFCKKTVRSSYFKVKAHLLKLRCHGVDICRKVDDDILKQLKKEDSEAEARINSVALSAKQKKDYVSLPDDFDLTQPKKRKGPLEKSFNVAEREKADKQCALMFYTGLLSFNFARNPWFREYSQTLANGNLHGYVPPTYERIRTTLRVQSRAHVDVLLKPIRDSWVKKGASICSDGWQDIKSRPIINLMIASSSGPMFLKSIDASDVMIKDANYLADIFSEAIEHVGENKVVQIITDNASNYKAAGTIIEEKYPHIFWTPCVVHCLNLAIKAICEPTDKSPQFSECEWISTLVKQVHDVNNFVSGHNLSQLIFNRYSNVELLSVAETRFASKIVMATRLRQVKDHLEKMVMDPDWKNFKVNGRTPAELKAREVKDLLVSDTWWDQIDYLLSFTEPMMNFLRATDTDTSVLHLVYDMWDTMIEEVKKKIFEHEGLDLLIDNCKFFDVVQQVIENRWNKSNTPLHCLAHSLVPKYYCEQWLQGGGDSTKRVAPNEDDEVSTNRVKCLQRIFSNEDIRKVFLEYGAFAGNLGKFSEPHIMAAREYEDPLSWWVNYGSSAPLLQSLANKLLSQPASSSCCERNWSSFGSIQAIKRNRLKTQTLEDLVYIHTNLRLLSRKKNEYTEGATKFWDIGGDKLGENPLQFAELSLNDPAIEAMTFD